MAKPTKNPFVSLREIDFRYHCNYDYDTDYSCDASGCDSICRCGTIINVKLKSFNLSNLYKTICNSRNVIDQYCVDRLLRINLNKIEYFDVSVCNGYYGQEIDSIKCNEAHKIDELLSQLFTFTNDNDKISFVLTQEYGYLLPKLSKASYNVEKVDLKDLRVPQRDYYSTKLDQEKVNSYKEYDLPIGVYTVGAKGWGFTLVDGYHRLAASQNKRKVQIIVARTTKGEF